jgi:hypothetical protein
MNRKKHFHRASYYWGGWDAVGVLGMQVLHI